MFQSDRRRREGIGNARANAIELGLVKERGQARLAGQCLGPFSRYPEHAGVHTCKLR
jgi:hypothetical protein